MAHDKENIKSNLDKYPFVKKFLGNIIEQRLVIECYMYGMLTAQLLDDSHSASDLKRLNDILNLGETYCQYFKRIFKEKRLPQVSEIADGQIIDLLAEVRAFEFLHSKSFKDIVKVRQQPPAKTVDFVATRNKQNFAIEVTRLGLAQTDRKQPKHMVEDNLTRHTISEKDELIGEIVGKWFLTSGKKNIPRITEAIWDAIKNKLPQMDDFCQTQGGSWNGILFISTGRDYFVMSKYANSEFEMHPNAVCEAIKEVWNLLKKELGDFKYLHNVIIAIDKDLRKAIIFPEL